MRRRCPSSVAITLLMTFGLTAFGVSAHAQGKGPYAGTSLRLLGANHPWTEAIKPLLEDFEGRTGTLESGAVGVSRGLFQEFPQAGRRPVA
jgi:hypothetical protein